MIDIRTKLEKYRREGYNNSGPSFSAQMLAKNVILKMNELTGCNDKAMILNHHEVKALFEFLPELEQWARQFSA